MTTPELPMRGDTSMCVDHDCPSRTKCLRFMARPDQYQVYADQGREEGAEKCGSFMPVEKGDT